MRAILINPSNRTVTEVDWDGEPPYRLLGCTTIEALAYSGEWLFVDEEAMLKPDPGPFFRLGVYTIAGKALLTGDDRPSRLPLPAVTFLGYNR